MIVCVHSRCRKEVLWQSAALGVVITMALFGSYTTLVDVLRSALGVEWGTDQMIFTILLNATHSLMYVSWNSVFAMFDAYNVFPQYKLPRKPHMVVKRSLIIKALAEQAFGQIIFNPLLTYKIYPTLVSHGLLPLDAALPPLAAMVRTLVIAHLINGVGFYVAHRLLHSSLLYSTLHKQHHEFAGTIGMAAEYASPLEQILANALPSLGGVIYFGGTHPLVFCVWLALRLQQTYEGHSGYCFEGTILDMIGLAHPHDAIHHDFHHTVNRGNFGFELMDWICGTQDHFMAAGGYEGYRTKIDANKKRT